MKFVWHEFLLVLADYQSVRLNNTSFVIYFSYQFKEMRCPTGFKVGPEKDKM
jgi:hypothetical protein